MTRTNLSDAIARATRNGITVRLIRGTARQLHLWPFLTDEEGEFMRIELQFTYPVSYTHLTLPTNREV